MRKVLTFITTVLITCIAITCITAPLITWGTWANKDTFTATAQTLDDQIMVPCPADANKKCLDIDRYEALNIMPREDRQLDNPSLGAYYGGTSSPPNPLLIKPGESVNIFFVGPQFFLPKSYMEGDVMEGDVMEGDEKYVPHVGAGPMWPLLSYPGEPGPIFTNNKVTFNSGDPSNPQEVKKEFGHAGVNDDPPSPTSAQYLISSGPITYNNPGYFVATARVQMIRHFWTVCSPSNWAFVPNKDDLCTSGQNPGRHSTSTEDKLIDITVSRLIEVK